MSVVTMCCQPTRALVASSNYTKTLRKLRTTEQVLLSLGPVPDLCSSQLLKPSFAYRKSHRKATYTLRVQGQRRRAERVMLEWRLQPLAEIPIVMYYNPPLTL